MMYKIVANYHPWRNLEEKLDHESQGGFFQIEIVWMQYSRRLVKAKWTWPHGSQVMGTFSGLNKAFGDVPRKLR